MEKIFYHFIFINFFYFYFLSREEQEVALAEYIKYLENYENKHLGNFRRIYPGPNTEKYDKFFQNSGSLFQETVAFKARSELAR